MFSLRTALTSMSSFYRSESSGGSLPSRLPFASRSHVIVLYLCVTLAACLLSTAFYGFAKTAAPMKWLLICMPGFGCLGSDRSGPGGYSLCCCAVVVSGFCFKRRDALTGERVWYICGRNTIRMVHAGLCLEPSPPRL